jgi:peptidoglycan/LPS O-acetylase OafA/YrhL
MTRPASQYFKSIDGLRLLASVNIVLFHIEKMGGLDNLASKPVWLFRIIKGPAFHASLFFLLAGFIFTVKYASMANTFSSRTFVKARLRDLYPLHLFTLIAMLVLIVVTCISTGYIDIWNLLYSTVVHLSFSFSMFPLYVESFNTPSWALSAFFLCYLSFGPVLRRIVSISSRRVITGLMILCFVPLLVWALLFEVVGDVNLYQYFHVFAPIRLFEFIIGMLLARLYFLNNSKPRSFQIQDIPLLNDLIIVLILAAIYQNIFLRAEASPFRVYLLYHFYLPPLYAVLLYRLARGNGVIAGFFGLKAIRDLGKCGFYPYLLHIPLISWVCWCLENFFGYRRFLHSPINIVLFMFVLYGGSWLYWNYARPRKGKTYRV